MRYDQKNTAVLTGSSSPEQLRADIEETRARLAEIADKLTPRAILAAQAKQRIDGARAAVADRAEDVAQTVSNHAGELAQTVSNHAEELVEKAKDAAPDAAIEAVSSAADEAKARKRPVGAAFIGIIATVVGLLVAKRGRSGSAAVTG